MLSTDFLPLLCMINRLFSSCLFILLIMQILNRLDVVCFHTYGIMLLTNSNLEVILVFFWVTVVYTRDFVALIRNPPVFIHSSCSIWWAMFSIFSSFVLYSSHWFGCLYFLGGFGHPSNCVTSAICPAYVAFHSLPVPNDLIDLSVTVPVDPLIAVPVLQPPAHVDAHDE